MSYPGYSSIFNKSRDLNQRCEAILQSLYFSLRRTNPNAVRPIEARNIAMKSDRQAWY